MYSQRLSIHSSVGDEHRLQRDQISPCKRDHDDSMERHDDSVIVIAWRGTMTLFEWAEQDAVKGS